MPPATPPARDGHGAGKVAAAPDRLLNSEAESPAVFVGTVAVGCCQRWARLGSWRGRGCKSRCRCRRCVRGTRCCRRHRRRRCSDLRCCRRSRRLCNSGGGGGVLVVPAAAVLVPAVKDAVLAVGHPPPPGRRQLLAPLQTFPACCGAAIATTL